MCMFCNLPAKTDEFENLTHKINTQGTLGSHSQMVYMNELERKQPYSEEERYVLHPDYTRALYLQTGRITQ